MVEAMATARRAPSVRLLVEFAAERGVPASVCLRHSGLRARRLVELDAVVSPEQELAVIANIVDALADRPGLGLAAGDRYHVTTHGIWGYALISSRTLRAAITLGLRYLDLSFSFCRIVARQEGDVLTLVVDPSPVAEPVRRFVAERDLGIIGSLHRELVGVGARARRAGLAYAEPDPSAREHIRRLLGLAPDYGAGRYSISFDLARIDEPLPLAEPHTAAMAEQQCRELLERQVGSGLAGRVRNLLLGNPARPPTGDQVAASLFMTPRTLRRRLIEEGSSYRRILDEVRRGLAEQLLDETRLSVGEIAERLGYAETAAFTHAFRRWTGAPPRAHRRARPRGA
ncbi:AraC family transcriptional regulator [Nocardia arizonensis]|uniref:AraC family transcriptional regulator n=1 Tax=Nocardia arizonensis TaxID=1141647 RepID=UPI000AA686B6|nr:AraC family transcriptional regulator [Nocardia arizonensis]